MDEARRHVRASGHQETGKVGYADVVEHIDSGQDEHADEREDEREDNVIGALAEIVRGFGDAEQDDEADGVGRDGPEIRFDDAEAEALDYLFAVRCGAPERTARRTWGRKLDVVAKATGYVKQITHHTPNLQLPHVRNAALSSNPFPTRALASLKVLLRAAAFSSLPRNQAVSGSRGSHQNAAAPTSTVMPPSMRKRNIQPVTAAEEMRKTP